ncbi:MAG: YciI family protein [Acidobacteria bacterium]|nr:YciI family protein [Acidobacteriota bacterium]MCI0628479.1 YciI family protein [Acidobacteriota bacterium]MCI0720674.1 YciI family protein [Acidobacteriota bacterium]
MKYILLIHHDEKAWDKLSETERQQIVGQYRQFTQQIKSSGHYLGGAPLQPTSAASSVRVRSGKRLVTDGPFAETREQLGGYFLIDAKDLDEAIGIATRIPAARWGTVEVRPVARPCDDDSIDS